MPDIFQLVNLKTTALKNNILNFSTDDIVFHCGNRIIVKPQEIFIKFLKKDN